MATVKCPLGKRGTPSHEWYDGEKSRIYCHGWIDSMTDAPLEACLNCPDHVSKAQDDLDKWRAEHGYTQKIVVQKRLIYAEDLFDPVDFKVFMCGRSGGKTMAMYEQLFRKRVEMAPTIDAVPVVRCKDCVSCYQSESSSTGYRCKCWGVYDTDCECDPDGFCNKGERRERK